MALILSSQERSFVVDNNGSYRGSIITNSSVFGYAWNGDLVYGIKDGFVLEMDFNRNPIRQFEYGNFKYPHQMLYHNDKLIITDSGHEDGGIVTLRPDSGEFKRIPLRGTWINSINWIDGNYYAIDHCNGPSRMFVMDEDFNIISEKRCGNMAHNVWKMCDDIWYCSSIDGTINSLKGECIPIGGFVRGVAMDNQFLYLGVSALRATLKLPNGHKRPFSYMTDETFTGVVVLDTKAEMKISNIIPVPSSKINEVRLLEYADLATPYSHNLFINWGDLPNDAILIMDGNWSGDWREETLTCLTAMLSSCGFTPVVIRQDDHLTNEAAVGICLSIIRQGYSPVVSVRDATSIRSALNELVLTLPVVYINPTVEYSEQDPVGNAEKVKLMLKKAL